MSSNQSTIYAVGELTQYIKHLLERDSVLTNVEVSGEISNLTYHTSGHVYFSLKDASAQISCVMFRSFAQRAIPLKRGDRVIVKGGISVYAPRGNYQFMVRSVRKAGVGDLYQQFLQLKAKLQAEGLFEDQHKQQIPAFPQHIAILTSATGAAVRDIIRTLHRRFPHLKVSLLPTVVQGLAGADSIVNNLKQAEKLAPDVLILGRGGGSIEDLWNFNEERVARAILACPIPIITGIGHETDFTIADFVADLRASTPTAAAEHAVPEAEAIRQTLISYQQSLEKSLQYFVDFKRQVLDDYSNRLHMVIQNKLREKRHQLSLLEAKLEAADMRKLLKQGYTLTVHQGKILTSKEKLEAGDELTTFFSDGSISSIIKEEQETES